MYRLGIKDPTVDKMEITGKLKAFIGCAFSSNCIKPEPGFVIEEKGPNHCRRYFVVRVKPNKNNKR